MEGRDCNEGWLPSTWDARKEKQSTEQVGL